MYSIGWRAPELRIVDLPPEILAGEPHVQALRWLTSTPLSLRTTTILIEAHLPIRPEHRSAPLVLDVEIPRGSRWVQGVLKSDYLLPEPGDESNKSEESLIFALSFAKIFDRSTLDAFESHVLFTRSIAYVLPEDFKANFETELELHGLVLRCNGQVYERIGTYKTMLCFRQEHGSLFRFPPEWLDAQKVSTIYII